MNKENHQTVVTLVVEDNYGDFFLVKEYLSDSMKHVMLFNARNFREAKHFMSNGENAPDLVLLDLSLPDHQGEELISDMMILAAGIPIIVFSGRSDDDFIAKAYDLGVAGYLSKDQLNPVILSDVIKDCLN